MPDIFLRQGAANPADIILRDPTASSATTAISCSQAQRAQTESGIAAAGTATSALTAAQMQVVQTQAGAAVAGGGVVPVVPLMAGRISPLFLRQRVMSAAQRQVPQEQDGVVSRRFLPIEIPAVIIDAIAEHEAEDEAVMALILELAA